MAGKIRSYRLCASGGRGAHISIPASWIEDVGLKVGDKVDLYRDEADRLIVCAPGTKPAPFDYTAVQAREFAASLAEAEARR